jgi:hypothetical protein
MGATLCADIEFTRRLNIILGINNYWFTIIIINKTYII